MFIRVTIVQVCDARDDDSSTGAGIQTHPNSLRSDNHLDHPAQAGMLTKVLRLMPTIYYLKLTTPKHPTLSSDD